VAKCAIKKFRFVTSSATAQVIFQFKWHIWIVDIMSHLKYFYHISTQSSIFQVPTSCVVVYRERDRSWPSWTWAHGQEHAVTHGSSHRAPSCRSLADELEANDVSRGRSRIPGNRPTLKFPTANPGNFGRFHIFIFLLEFDSSVSRKTVKVIIFVFNFQTLTVKAVSSIARRGAALI